MFDSGRQADIEFLTQQLKGASGSRRRDIENSIRAICNESGLVRSMREALIKETRNGRLDNVKDIHEYIKRRKKYQNE
jgi:hypothetical protein